MNIMFKIFTLSHTTKKPEVYLIIQNRVLWHLPLGNVTYINRSNCTSC